MALNIPGVVAVVLFYTLILATGVFAARKSRKAERKSHGNRTEVVLLGDRNINLVVGIFTMTGKLFSLAQKLILAQLIIGYMIINSVVVISAVGIIL